MKKILLSLFVGLFGFISFCSAGSYTVDGDGCFGRIPIPYSSYGDCNITVHCVFTVSDGYAFLNFRVSSFYGNGYNIWGSNNLLSDSIVPEVGNPAVFDYDFSTYSPSNGQSCLGIPFLRQSTCSNYSTSLSYSCTFSGDSVLSVGGSCPECPTCDDPYTSEQCQYLYDLIPVESVDTNYCVGNGLCPNECGSGTDYTGDLQFSNIFINNVLHPGRENIFIDIPDYIYWDYSIDTGNFNLYVGSGYDQDYIDGILSINTYKPSSEDFTQVFVSGLTLIFPYIFVALFIIFVWKLLKRIFK